MERTPVRRERVLATTLILAPRLGSSRQPPGLGLRALCVLRSLPLIQRFTEKLFAEYMLGTRLCPLLTRRCWLGLCWKPLLGPVRSKGGRQWSVSSGWEAGIVKTSYRS